MDYLKKLKLNFSARAVSTVGPTLFSKYIIKFIKHMPQIIQSNSLVSLDRAMCQERMKISYRRNSFLFDIRYCDDKIRDGTFAFGQIREIFIRDCYFRFHSPKIFQTIKTVLDIGANRGAFSVFSASLGAFVICVEAQPEFIPVIEHNMAINGFSNYKIHCEFVGSGGVLGAGNYPLVTLEQIFECYGIQNVDFVKIDIEGSEFGLFDSPAWLERVKALSLEVHPKYGAVFQILDSLKKYSFQYVLADENVCSTTDTNRASFIYAWKHSNKLL